MPSLRELRIAATQSRAGAAILISRRNTYDGEVAAVVSPYWQSTRVTPLLMSSAMA